MDTKEDLRIKPDYDTHRIKDYLTSEQITKLGALRESIPEKLLEDGHISAWCTDSTLCRFLRAKGWDQQQAQDQLTNTLQWRLSYKPHKITANDVKGELNNTGKMYRNGWDKFDRPVLYMKPGKDNTGSAEREEKVRYLVYVMEKCAKAAQTKNREKLCLIIDWTDNSSISGLSNLQTSREILDILQNHYPESLGKAFMFNAPWSFSIFWSMISPFVETVTQEKITFASSNDQILQFVEASQLETPYGGTNKFKYSFDEHWQKEEEI